MAQSRAGWIFRAESGWAGWWREVRAVLARAVRVVLAAPGTFLFLMAAVLVVHLPVLNWAIPFDPHDPPNVMLVAAYAYVTASLKFVLAVVVWSAASDVIRGRGPFRPVNFVVRLGLCLPWALLVYLARYLTSFLEYGLYEAAGMAAASLGIETPAWTGTATHYVGTVLLLLAYARFGLVLPGAASGDRVTLGLAWKRSRPAAGPLLLTLVLWTVALMTPHWFTLWLMAGDGLAVDLEWPTRLYLTVVFVYFAVVAAVWYERLRPESGEA